jgi:uncharacterized protein (TIGR02246 family)
MSESATQTVASTNKAEIRALIDRWAQAVRDENRPAIRADHDDNILMFDVPPPFLSQGLDAYMATWETFFAHVKKPVVFDFTDVKVTTGNDVAFATAVGHCFNIDPTGKREPLDFRLTMGLRKINGRWRILHEHHSLPAV